MFNLSHLWPWRDRTRLHSLAVTVYTRRGCHLCAEAWEVLQADQAVFGYQLKAIDVDSDPELVGRFGERVPVIAVNGRIRFYGGVNPVLWKRFLTGEARRVPPSA